MVASKRYGLLTALLASIAHAGLITISASVTGRGRDAVVKRCTPARFEAGPTPLRRQDVDRAPMPPAAAVANTSYLRR